MEKIINIFGSSGSGSTTLANQIASRYDYYHIDVDDMLWEKTDPPFTIRRSDLEARKCIINELKNQERVVISGSLVGFGDDIKDRINLFVFINLDIETRIKRIEKEKEKDLVKE